VVAARLRLLQVVVLVLLAPVRVLLAAPRLLVLRWTWNGAAP